MKVAVVLVLCVLSAFAVEEDKRLVYGTDDRTEPYSITDSDLLKLVQADVALIPSQYFSQNGDGSYSLIAYDTFTQGDCSGGTDALCQDEPFRTQILAPFCSGFLVHSNVIVTAGHCLDGNSPSDFYVIFDWKQQSSGVGPSLNIDQDNVYEPETLDYMLTNTEDWGVVYLNRDVVGRTPLNYRTSGTPDVGTPLVLVGHPWGLPMKVAPNAEIKTYPSDSNTFSANTDSYAGNSGSMVVNADTWEVEGILVTGNTDFKYDSVNGCCRSNVCSDSTGCAGTYEGVTKITVPKISDAIAVQPALMLVAVVLAVLNAF